MLSTLTLSKNLLLPVEMPFATLLGGLLSCRLVHVHISVDNTSLLALLALLAHFSLSLSVVPGAVLVVGGALLVPALISRPRAIGEVTLLLNGGALLLILQSNVSAKKVTRNGGMGIVRSN